MNIFEVYNNVPKIILQEFIKLKINKNALVKNQKFEEASELRDKERNIENLYNLSDFMIYLNENGLSLEVALRDIKIEEILN